MIENYIKKYADAVNALGSIFKSPYNTCNLKEHENILVYLKGDEVIAFIQYMKMYETVEIEYLAVDERYRRLGIGSEFLEYLSRDLEIERLVIEVRVSNENAIVFYESTGFKKVRPIKNYYRDGEDALFMEKVIR